MGRARTGRKRAGASIILTATGYLWVVGAARAQDATWLTSPPSDVWNNAANWSPATVPRDTAFFGASNIISLTFSSDAAIGTLQFKSNAPAYTFRGIITP